MGTVELIYLIFFFLGLGFALVSFLLSGVFGGADLHVDAGIDAGGDLGTDGGHSLHFMPLSPATISMFLATFGGTGLIAHRLLGWSLPLQITSATLSGFVVAGAVGTLFYRISRAETSSEVHLADLIGHEAEVTVSIPSNGVGQITYIHGGRYSAPARAVDEVEIPSRSIVKIAKIVGNTYYVERIP